MLQSYHPQGHFDGRQSKRTATWHLGGRCRVHRIVRHSDCLSHIGLSKFIKISLLDYIDYMCKPGNMMLHDASRCFTMLHVSFSREIWESAQEKTKGQETALVALWLRDRRLKKDIKPLRRTLAEFQADWAAGSISC